MFDVIAKLVTTRWGVGIVLAWIATVAVLDVYAPDLKSVSRDDDVRYFPPDSKSVIGQDLLERGFPSDAASSQAVVIFARPDADLTRQDFTFVRQISSKLVELADDRPDFTIRNVINSTAPVIGPRLTAKRKDGPGEATLVIVALNSTYLSKKARLAVDELERRLEAWRDDAPPGLQLALTGSAVVGHDINSATNDSIATTTYTTVGLVVAILLLVYRSPILAFIPLATIAVSVFVSLKIMAVLATTPGLNFQVINITEIFVVVVLFGAGTDYCLFLIARYREELGTGLSRPEALAESIRRTGGALLASAGTVICGLGLLYFSSFAKIQNTGPAIALSLAVALLASLTLAPVLLRWLGKAVFWPFAAPKVVDPHPEQHGFWGWVATAVVRHPGSILAASLAVMVPLAIVGAATKSNYSQLADLSPNQPSVLGARTIQRFFPVGELSPTTLLLHHPQLGFRDTEGRQAIATLSQKLAAIPRVAEVRSLTQPVGKPEPPPGPLDFRKLLAQGTDRLTRIVAENRYISAQPVDPADREHITRFELTLSVDPFSTEALEVLETISRTVEAEIAAAGPLSGVADWGLAGATSAIEDLKRVTTNDERRMYWMVTLGVYLVLVFLLRMPGICLYLMATVVLGYLASLGITEIVFRELVWQDSEPWAGLDWKVGFFLFVILIAIGEDYNIFLMSRVVEEQRDHGRIEGVRRAVAATGGIISSCGLIMAGTFFSMLTGNLVALQELGFALGLGVLLDTFVVRPILVPAFIVLLERLIEARRSGKTRSPTSAWPRAQAGTRSAHFGVRGPDEPDRAEVETAPSGSKLHRESPH